MGNVDRSLISIFKSSETAPEMLQSMRDIASLAGVLSDLGSHIAYESPIENLRLLRIIQLINEEALGMDDPIENADMLYYRYSNRYDDSNPPTKKKVEQIVNVLVKFNWISKQSRQLKMRDAGKRMMEALIRLANDSLAYYMNDEIGRSLFQARRDAEISEAYDDRGISGGNAIASMIRNVEDATRLLKERELEMLADRNALSQLEIAHELMEELEVKLDERFRQFQTFEDSLVLSYLMQKGTSALAEGTNLSLGMIKKFVRFTHMQHTPLSQTIHPEKVRKFIIDMYDPPLDSDVPNAYQLFSFLEQNQYEDEALDGIWVPVKFASPLSYAAIDEAIDYIETYEPKVMPLEEQEEAIHYQSEEITIAELEDMMGESSWLLTKSMIETEMIEQYLMEHKEAPMEQLVIEATSAKWSDAVNALTAVSALVGNKKVTLSQPTEQMEQQAYEKEWEWMDHEDAATIVRQRKPSQQSEGEQ
ncbi:hypothetical protein MKZ26_04560 [Sporosarcina sp. FSL K6-6792]|uniref:hypothetical protein n=1 Tax=Sporosarcina sp. FSL K6-6792 TaxID=2921559 RepID=UPI0030F8D2C9